MVSEQNLTREFIAVLSGHGRRYVAVLWAYLDESGTHKGAPVLNVAGYLGSEQEWHKFEKEWSPKLKKANVPYFHATDPDCSSLKLPLASAITKRVLQGVICSVNTNEYNLHASHQFKSVLGNAYATCAYGCALKFGKLACGVNKKVSIVLEAGQKNIDHVERVLKIMMNNPDFCIAGVMRAIKEDFVPLQTADFLAHSVENDRAWFDYLNEFGNVMHARPNPKELIEMSIEIKKLYMKQRILKERSKREQKANLSKP